jgi:hypothetical protein
MRPSQRPAELLLADPTYDRSHLSADPTYDRSHLTADPTYGRSHLAANPTYRPIPLIGQSHLSANPTYRPIPLIGRSRLQPVGPNLLLAIASSPTVALHLPRTPPRAAAHYLRAATCRSSG